MRPSNESSASLSDVAPAKINLTLHVRARRADGYHEIESLFVFADIGDRLSLEPDVPLDLSVSGPMAAAAGPSADNLVLKAARALAAQAAGLRLGRYLLDKHLPVAAGLGGGSADAAAALRLLARLNRIPMDDPRLHAAARATGADVPACLDPRPRVVRGIGEILGSPLALPRIAGVLVNPGIAVATRDVFGRLQVKPGGDAHPDQFTRSAWLSALSGCRNDLETPALAIAPAIGDALVALRALPGCRLARMSGSGATCFALFDTPEAAAASADALARAHPAWWVRAVSLGGATPSG